MSVKPIVTADCGRESLVERRSDRLVVQRSFGLVRTHAGVARRTLWELSVASQLLPAFSAPKDVPSPTLARITPSVSSSMPSRLRPREGCGTGVGGSLRWLITVSQRTAPRTQHCNAERPPPSMNGKQRHLWV